MKKLFVLALVIAAAFKSQAQLNPVSWTFSAKKTGDKQYEIQMKATIDDKWHLYSQVQPEDAIVNPTAFTFNPNPLFAMEGKVREDGKMEKFNDKQLGVSANQYSHSVTFTQKIRLKANVKTKVTGNVEFQTCDDKKCLPPKTVPFSIAIR